VAVAAVDAYAKAEARRLIDVQDLARKSDGLVLWGMASKGVILAALLPKGLIVGGIDMNTAKQGRFAAATGVMIHPPEWLIDQSGKTVAVMNPNYVEEVGELVGRIGADVELISIEAPNTTSDR